MAEKKQKKAVTKKSLAKKATVKKTVVKKPRPLVTKKAIAGSSVRSATAGKTSAKKAPVKKAAVKKTATKKTAPVRGKSTSVTKKTAKKTNAPKKRSSRKTNNDEECFLTTACVSYYSLNDDTYELMTLRTFRDQYMLKSKEGSALVKNYYRVAPVIVSMIRKDKDQQAVYRYIYTCIQQACAKIEQKRSVAAQQIYVSLVNTLLKKYAIN